VLRVERIWSEGGGCETADAKCGHQAALRQRRLATIIELNDTSGAHGKIGRYGTGEISSFVTRSSFFKGGDELVTSQREKDSQLANSKSNYLGRKEQPP